MCVCVCVCLYFKPPFSMGDYYGTRLWNVKASRPEVFAEGFKLGQ